MIIYATAWRGSDKFKDSIFKNTRTFSLSKVRIYIVPFNYCNKKERLLKKLRLMLKKGILSTFSLFSDIGLKKYWGVLFLFNLTKDS